MIYIILKRTNANFRWQADINFPTTYTQKDVAFGDMAYAVKLAKEHPLKWEFKLFEIEDNE